jgi:hypothetical protein
LHLSIALSGQGKEDMTKLLDDIYYRFKRAFEMFKYPDLYYSNYQEGVDNGKAIAYAIVKQKLDIHDPYQFENNHFKLGYYYAYEQVQQVMENDGQDNGLGQA